VEAVKEAQKCTEKGGLTQRKPSKKKYVRSGRGNKDGDRGERGGVKRRKPWEENHQGPKSEKVLRILEEKRIEREENAGGGEGDRLKGNAGKCKTHSGKRGVFLLAGERGGKGGKAKKKKGTQRAAEGKSQKRHPLEKGG